MQIGKTLYVTTRKAWRAWLRKNHKKQRDIWLIYYKKGSNKPRVPYNDAVEEALCYGWIDSITKSINNEKYAQRFSPRKPDAKWSAMNIERLRRLIRQRKVTKTGLQAAWSVIDHIRQMHHSTPVHIPPDILKALKSDPIVWKNFSRFPDSYKRIRIGWIDGSRKRPDVFRQRMNYFLRMTARNKRFGMVQ